MDLSSLGSFMKSGDWLGGALQNIAQIGFGIASYKQQQDMIRYNKDQNKLQLALNLAQNQQTREREDNAVQRRMADLQAAGLSPVLAAGSAANTTQPIAANTRNVEGNSVLSALSAMQGKANIAATNAGTRLTQFQSESEQVHKMLMERQARESEIKAWSEMEGIKEIESRINFNNAQTKNMDLRNQWFVSDMLSNLNLRGAQAQNLKEMAKLNIAKTAYEQTNLDMLKTQIDNEKLLRDINNVHFHYADSLFRADIFNKYTAGGNPVKFLSGAVRDTLENLRKSYAPNRSWYWEFQ